MLVQNKSTVSRLSANYTLDSFQSNCTKCFFPSNAITRVCTSESSTTVHEEAHKEEEEEERICSAASVGHNALRPSAFVSPEAFSRGECMTLG